MKHNKFLQFLALLMVSTAFLTACSGEPTDQKEESGSKGESSQGQTENGTEGDGSLNGGENATQSEVGNQDQTVGSDGTGNTSASSNPGANQQGSSGNGQSGNSNNSSNGNTNDNSNGSSNGNSTDSNKTEQSTPSQSPENPSEGGGNQSTDPKPNTSLTYAEYIAKTPAEQQAYYETYDNFMDFVAWYNAAKAKYDAENEVNRVEGGKIDIGEIMNEKN